MSNPIYYKKTEKGDEVKQTDKGYFIEERAILKLLDKQPMMTKEIQEELNKPWDKNKKNIFYSRYIVREAVRNLERLDLVEVVKRK